jgi:hypothetical protein
VAQATGFTLSNFCSERTIAGRGVSVSIDPIPELAASHEHRANPSRFPHYLAGKYRAKNRLEAPCERILIIGSVGRAT